MKFFSLFLLFILPLSLTAKDSEWLIGVEGGISEAKFSSKNTDSGRVFSPQYGFKIGLRNQHARYYLGYNQNNEFGTDLVSSKTAYLALEGITDAIKVTKRTKARLFLGTHLGAASAVIDGTGATEYKAYAKDPTITAFIIGFQFGFVLLLPADFEIELAYRHYLAFKPDKNFNVGTVYGGLNYKFHAF
jgi:hypothetical protein